MKSKFLFLLVFMLITLSALNVNAGLFSKDKIVYMQLNKSVYYLPINDQNTNIPLEIVNEYDSSINSILKISMTQKISQQGYQSTQSKSQSDRISIDPKSNVIPLGISSGQETEIDFTFTLTYYNEDKEEDITTVLKTKVFFIDPNKDDNEQNQDQQSQSSKKEKPQKSQDQKSQSSSQNSKQSQKQDQASQTSKKLQDSQNSQNTNALRDQMKKQEQERKQKEQEFQNNVMQNEDFQKQHEQLTKEGYELENFSNNVNNSNDGDFKANYKKPNGEGAQVKGSLQNDSIEDLAKQTSEDKKEMLDNLNNNSKFKKLQENLEKSGFNLSNQEFGDYTNTTSQMTLEYKNNETNETVSIEVDFENNDVDKLEHNHKNKNSILFFLILIVLGFLMYFYASKMKYTEEEVEEVKVSKKNFDYKKWCQKTLKKSKEEYDKKNQKEAYSLLSKAIRTYLSHKFSDGHELLYIDAKKLAKSSKFNIKMVSDTLDSCEMAIFAGIFEHNFNNFHSFFKDKLN